MQAGFEDVALRTGQATALSRLQRCSNISTFKVQLEMECRDCWLAVGGFECKISASGANRQANSKGDRVTQIALIVLL